MTKVFAIFILQLVLTACASKSTTTQSWSCRAVGNQTCASIHEIDNRSAGQDKQVPRTAIFGARLANWWDAPAPTSVTREDAPRREYDQTMRILLAPYVDAQGDYHDRAEVYAVMRKAQWWIAPPVPVTASPEPGASLPPPASPTPEKE
ncbi:TraV family lipoprotein [Asticcacaulis biprosthecium]|uniref:TraV family lipoprotein n=1 Tax=Asticcacaulis biprosthecium TaxID=76891 RepID=UPI00058BED01|nr:TraV family lipoprotein [Asticcacaulis biprosthecium]